MDSVFFWVSKIVWTFISPDSLLLVMFLAGIGLLMTKRRQSGRILLLVSGFCALLIALLPIADWLYLPLEKRFVASPSLPNTIDGIIVLGGFIDTQTSDAWKQVQTNDAAERLLAFQALARQYPNAKLMFSGGNGTLDSNGSKEADSVASLMTGLGLADREIILESQSRNTWENVRLSKAMVAPRADEHWLMITSAAHMPRAVGIFCSQQWPITPYPVDFRANREQLLRLEMRFAENLLALRQASREWLGLIAYFLSAKTSQFLPDSNSACVRAY